MRDSDRDDDWLEAGLLLFILFMNAIAVFNLFIVVALTR